MNINAKSLLFFSALMGLLVLVLAVISLYSFREFSLYTAERHARSVAETIQVGLTESMVNETDAKPFNAKPFIERLAGVSGVNNVRILRGSAVVKQFGPGLTQGHQADKIENPAFIRGKASFDVLEKEGDSIFRAIIPYIATDQGTPNCLKCHEVSNGTVLGAVAIDIPLSDIKRQALTATAIVSLTVFLTALLALLLLRRMLRPLVETANAVKTVVTQAVGGAFHGRIEQRTSDEVGEIAVQLNKLMEYLDKGIDTIGRRVGELMDHHQQPLGTGNQLVTTTEMVEGLVEVSRFKQAIEEDQTKLEVYQRLVNVLSDKYDFHQFSVYEVASSKNRMTPIAVDGEINAPCRWCDQQILIDANTCRVKRTGHEVNGIDSPGICTMFRGENDEGEKYLHICLPITQSGTVGCVVQIVASPDEAQFAKLLVPFIAVYLRETAPVLEAKRLAEYLRENSLRDAMTGLYNRRFLEEYTTTLVATSQRRKSPFSVLMLDLDYFKQVNDTFGHEAGDKVLKTLAETLIKSVRASDMVIRYGGEEFLIVLLDTGAEAAMNVAEKIRAKVEETRVSLPGTMLQKTISIGVAEFPVDSDTFWQAVKFADVALYEAKTQGRNRVIRFIPSMWTTETGKI